MYDSWLPYSRFSFLDNDFTRELRGFLVNQRASTTYDDLEIWHFSTPKNSKSELIIYVRSLGAMYVSWRKLSKQQIHQKTKQNRKLDISFVKIGVSPKALLLRGGL